MARHLFRQGRQINRRVLFWTITIYGRSFSFALKSVELTRSPFSLVSQILEQNINCLQSNGFRSFSFLIMFYCELALSYCSLSHRAHRLDFTIFSQFFPTSLSNAAYYSVLCRLYRLSWWKFLLLNPGLSPRTFVEDIFDYRTLAGLEKN